MEIEPKTHLEPDILVFGANQSLRRIYDRDFKRDAYLAIGVAEVWLVDWWDETVYASKPGAPVDAPRASELTWHPAAMERPLALDLREVFLGLI